MMLFSGLLLVLVANVHCANILAIIPFPSWSHQQPLLSVATELAKRGHNLTVITANPPKEPIPNWKTIDTSSSYKAMQEEAIKSGFLLNREWNAFFFVPYLAPTLAFLSDYSLSLPQVKEFIRTADKTHFELVLYEDFMLASFGGLVHKIGSPPVVGIHTLPNLFTTDWAMGVPVNPSYMPDMYVGYTDRMAFFERVYNTIFYWWLKYQWEMKILPMQEAVLRKHFGSDPPKAREFEYNKSLVLLPTDLTMAYAEPLPPNVIQLGPFHVYPPKPLPKDLQEYLDEAEDGVVYFSLGSIMRGSALKPEIRDAFVNVFAKFPKLRFLWKWESDEKVPGLSSNVITRKWFPQQDIVAHKKLRLIIMQGGLQSLEESIQYGIPILGIPLFSDQRHNTWKLAREGAGISLEMHEVNDDSLFNAINKIVYKEKTFFKENAMRLTRLAKDEIVPAMEAAIWWVEYVMRHKGARHLRVSSLDLSWYQLALIDVYGFLLCVLLILSYSVYFVIKSIFKRKNVSSTRKKENRKSE